MNDQSSKDAASNPASEPDGLNDDADGPEPIEVAWGCEPDESIDSGALLARVAAVCAEAGVEPMHFSVVIVDDDRIADMHARFLGVEGTTDTITFDLRDDAEQGTGVALEGEVYICVDEARRRAESMGRPLFNELLLYATHGLLHLLGYDDHDPEGYRRMHAREDELLTAIGVGAVFNAQREDES
ncbi:MAG: rRNA maturation RNase YbeY [Planctomycetota bacterium]